MSLMRNSIVHLGSWAALFGFGAWSYFDFGFEPVIGLVASAVGVAANFQDFPLWSGRKLTPEKKIELRDKWRPIIEEFFLTAARDKYRTDVIVHDVARLDHYPHVDEKSKGISSWFRVGFMGTYQRGVLLGLRWTYVSEEPNGQWKEYHSKPPQGATKVMLLAEVPYELIESFNSDGDEFYNEPHLYLHFDYAGQPYARLFYGEENQLFPDSPRHFTEVTVFKPPSWFQRLKDRLRRSNSLS